jgi:hypothetical protein
MVVTVASRFEPVRSAKLNPLRKLSGDSQRRAAFKLWRPIEQVHDLGWKLIIWKLEFQAE